MDDQDRTAPQSRGPQDSPEDLSPDFANGASREESRVLARFLLRVAAGSTQKSSPSWGDTQEYDDPCRVPTGS